MARRPMALLLQLVSTASLAVQPGLSVPRQRLAWQQRWRTILASAMELQRDCGRGQEHLSARLQEGDACVYQIGSWMVDWVMVGPGDTPRLLLARVDCLQINWTTDCEHGRILATPVSALDGNVLRIDEDVEYAGIEFGPEQLVARVPVEWASEYEGTLLAPLPATLAASLPEEDELVVETGS